MLQEIDEIMEGQSFALGRASFLLCGQTRDIVSKMFSHAQRIWINKSNSCFYYR